MARLTQAEWVKLNDEVSALLDDSLWKNEGVTQRITRAEYRKILLAERDTIIIAGRIRRLCVKHVDLDVYDLYVEPLKKDAQP